MSKPIIYKDLEIDDKFNVAFPDGHIPKGFIDKTKTRLGITYTNFHDNRHTITTIPSTAIIDDALTEYPYLGLFPVWDGVTPKDVADYLRDDSVKIKRLVPTPESFGKIITGAASIGKEDWLYKNVFNYLDEVHCYATEAFRDDILRPFDYASKFNKYGNLAMGSATVFPFSDPRIAAMQHYKIRFREKFGTINIINHYSPKAVLHDMMMHPDQFPGNVHTFFNSVTEIGDLVRSTGITDVNIFCRDDERNMISLEDAKIYFRSKPVKEHYKKFNFYSCKFNDGWNLKDDETATLILVTDTSIPHSLIGIPFKGFQAVGRLKATAHKIYHITNDFGKSGMKQFGDIQKDWLYNAEAHIEFHNLHAGNCRRDSIQDNGLLYNLVKPFSDVKEGIAKLNPYKLDQRICEEYCKEHYNNAATIEQTWQSMNYNTTRSNYGYVPIVRAKKTQAEVNKGVVERLEELKNHPETYVYEPVSATLKKYKTDYPLLLDAYEILGKDEIVKLKYNDKAMKEALIKVGNQHAEAKLRLMLIDEFKLNSKHAKQAMKIRLQQLYNQLGIRKPDGQIKVAKATDFESYGFKLKDSKIENDKGELKPGFEIIKLNFTVKQAA